MIDFLKNMFTNTPTFETLIGDKIKIELSKESSSSRPSSFLEYIGQEKAKNIIQKFIASSLKRNTTFPHTLIHGEAGMGKTTLVNIIAKNLGLPMKEVIGETEPEKLLEIVMGLNGRILFIDEVHALKTETMEKLYSLMEDFKYNGKKIPEFTLFGATTEMGEMMKRAKPFYDRFKIIVELERYTLADLNKIAEGYLKRKYPNDYLEKTAISTLSKNSRGTPRGLLRLIDTAICFEGNIKETLKFFNILYNGFTDKDLRILQYLASNEKGTGLQGLTAYLNTSQQNYLYNNEPYLIQNQMILRTPRGRMISPKGARLIKKLEKL